jgi:hypothetical protein
MTSVGFSAGPYGPLNVTDVDIDGRDAKMGNDGAIRQRFLSERGSCPRSQ